MCTSKRIIQIGIKIYIPHSKEKPKHRHQFLWFSEECDNARFVKIWTHEKLLNRPCPDNQQFFVGARKSCGRIVSDSKMHATTVSEIEYSPVLIEANHFGILTKTLLFSNDKSKGIFPETWRAA